MPYSLLRIQDIYLMALAAGVCSWFSVCTAATFELAKRPDGTIIRGVKLEGEIAPGDSQKLLDVYNTYGEFVSPIYLRSRGGNVEEAMKMGAIIRRLRLETDVPVRDAGAQPIDSVKIDHQDNMICASACFLVYAGGAKRFGNYLVLHRPYLPREEAGKISDLEYENLQKEFVPKIKSYLVDMEIDQYWIDRMFAASSQDQYMPTLAEADSKLHHLTGLVPSIEEIVLAQCNKDDLEKTLLDLRNTGQLFSAEGKRRLDHAIEESQLFSKCESTVMSDMQRAAFERENNPILAMKCDHLPSLTGAELLTLKSLIAKAKKEHTPEEEQLGVQLFTKYQAKRQCEGDELYHLQIAAFSRWSKEVENSKRTAAGRANDK